PSRLLSPSRRFAAVARPHPTCPLFPYTTLFRSLLRCYATLSIDIGNAHTLANTKHLVRFNRLHVSTQCTVIFTYSDLYTLGASKDRKSTRLNSSHVSLSYAVFCWEKKTRTVETP